jgi:YD repeat-containing protein
MIYQLAAIISLCILSADSVDAADKPSQTVRYYSQSGIPIGRSTTSGNVTRFYNARGIQTGHANQSGNVVRLYDASGRLIITRK